MYVAFVVLNHNEVRLSLVEAESILKARDITEYEYRLIIDQITRLCMFEITLHSGCDFKEIAIQLLGG